MADASTTPDTPITDVVRGILGDFQQLMTQQVALLRSEVKKDWDITKMAMCPLATGMMLGMVALLEFGIAAGLGIYAAGSPVADPARIPMWGCFALAGLGFAIVGGILILVGTRTFQSFNPVPDETMRAFEKNLDAFVAGSNAPSGAPRAR
jgi:hypothetical protein